jgi:ADP-heptose:LPS heptosyltransferase
MRKILIINPFGIGDVIFSFFLAQALKTNPDLEIHYLCNERTQELVSLNPAVKKVHIFHRDHFRVLFKRNFLHGLKELASLLKQINTECYEACFDLSMGKEYAFFMMCMGIKKRMGFNYKGRGLFLTHKRVLHGLDEKPVRDYYLSLMDFFDKGVASKVLRPALSFGDRQAPWTKRLAKLGIKGRYAVVSPGGGKSWGENAHFKQWDPDSFARTAKALSERHGLQILWIGDGEERTLCDRVRQLSGLKNSILLTEDDLGFAAWVLKESQLFIGNDGGLLHLANLVRTPVMGFFGPVDEKVYGPSESLGSVKLLTQKVPCRPCYRKFHFPECQYAKRCLTEISVERVLNVAESLLNESAGKIKS